MKLRCIRINPKPPLVQEVFNFLCRAKFVAPYLLKESLLIFAKKFLIFHEDGGIEIRKTRLKIFKENTEIFHEVDLVTFFVFNTLTYLYDTKNIR